MVEFLTWGPPGSQIDPRGSQYAHEANLDPKMTSKWTWNWTFFYWEIIAIRLVICVYGGTAKADQKVLRKKWREFRPCRSHFFEARRPHSTQRARKPHRKIGESSVSVNGSFLSDPAALYTADEKAVPKNWRAFRPCSWLFSTEHRPQSTQRARQLAWKNTIIPSMRTIDVFTQLSQELIKKVDESSVHAVEFDFSLPRSTLQSRLKNEKQCLFHSPASVNDNQKLMWSDCGVGGMALATNNEYWLWTIWYHLQIRPLRSQVSISDRRQPGF